ncbi:MAG: hypothetical protein FWD28_01860 [Treponema sp.]|nr:hypothetical protein [Treponema sp.]
MQNKKSLFFLILFAMLLISCIKENNDNYFHVTIDPNFTAKIIDLNGVWQPNWSYIASKKMTKEEIEEENARSSYQKEYSWGIGEYILHTTTNIDVTAPKPFLEIGGDGRFFITDIALSDINTININAYNGDITSPETCWFIEATFHFVNKDTLWIESKQLDEGGIKYGKGAYWHRFSGTKQQE